MALNIVLMTIILCVVSIEVKSESGFPNREECMGKSQGYTRIKRAKYYSNPPSRFYRKPPLSYPLKGLFSYTPPPNYMMDEEEPQYPGPPTNLRPYKVSKRANDGLGEEDINNIVKYLSKQDLDKIVEIAVDKDKFTSKYIRDFPTQIDNRPTNKYNEYLPVQIDNRQVGQLPSSFKTNDQEIETDDTNKFSLNGPYVKVNNEYRPYKIDYYNPNINYIDTQARILNRPQEQQTFSETPLNTEESMLNKQITFVNSFVQQEGYDKVNEEVLPKPLNLREDEYDISYTNNVPSVVKTGSYKVENFGNLPLMNYNSKPTSLSSYSVPHYTVTSPNKQASSSFSSTSSSSFSSTSSASSASSISSPPIEPAPPASFAKEQSDAHLKAIKIWTHKSKGTAYTLYDDGSLSLESPSRPKIQFGHP